MRQGVVSCYDECSIKHKANLLIASQLKIGDALQAGTDYLAHPLSDGFELRMMKNPVNHRRNLLYLSIHAKQAISVVPQGGMVKVPHMTGDEGDILT